MADHSLINMKMSAAERKDDDSEIDDPEFPWGLSLHLDDATLTKLGMDLPEVGTLVDIHAVGKVTSVNESADESGERRSTSIQITDLEIDSGSTEADKAKKMFS